MGIESALYTGVSGLDAMSSELSVIGNNISNSNTVGFKGGSVTFANLLSTSLGATSSTQTGNGVSLENVGTDFSQGTLQTTSNPLDMAIQGSGFFIVTDSSGSQYFTRAGQFSVDKSGMLVNPNGDCLQGKVALTQPVTSKTGQTTPGTFGSSGDINISAIGVGTPTPTANATIYANLLESTQAVDGLFNINSTNDQIVVSGTAVSGSAIPATIITIANGNGIAGSVLAANVGSAINTLFGGNVASVAYGSAGSASQYEFTINNISAGDGGTAGAITIQWNNQNTTASNMLGFTDTSTFAVGSATTADFQVAGFDPLSPGGAFSTAMTVYDSDGNSHLTNVYFENLGASSSAPGGGNRWMWTAVVPATDSVSGNPQIAASGLLDFNDNGALWSVNSNVNGAIYNSRFNFSGGVAQDQQITFDFGQVEGETLSQPGGSGTTGITQYGSPSSVADQFQDGYAAGSLQSYSVSESGIITGTFTNGQTKNIAQIDLARFNAADQLTNVGNNCFTQSAGSGQPIPGLAGDAGFGSIFSDSLEESNVDLSSEFVNMITVQSAYEANAKVISTAQELFTALQNAKQ